MKKFKKDDIFDLATKASQQPQEVMMPHKSSSAKLKIGVPKETVFEERRVALCPESVRLLVSYGFELLVETQAGVAAVYNDNDYSEAGAFISHNNKEVFACDILIKIAFPTLDEINLMKKGQILFSAVNLYHLEKSAIEAFQEKNITAFAFEYIRDDSGILSFIQSMSEIAGKASVMIASEYLTGNNSSGILLGGITGVPPSQILIFGAGTVGQYAAKTAMALGADIKVFDNALYKLRRLRAFSDLNVYTSVITTELVLETIKTADVVIGALRPVHGRVPCVLTEEMIMTMKENSVLIDVSIDQGGCFETSEVTTLSSPVFKKHGVIHYGVPNIPSIVPRTASVAISNIICPILLELHECKNLDTYLWEHPNARDGIYVYKGILTKGHIGDKFNMNGKSIDLLLTSGL